MSILFWSLIVLVAAVSSACGAAFVLLRARNMQNWIVPYVRTRKSRAEMDSRDESCDVFVSVCDHFEPECYGASREVARARIRRWLTEYPQLFGSFQDAEGRPPQHTFFFPQDEYRPEYLDELAELCRDGFGDVDVHLHHDHDTADGLRRKLEEFRDALHERHGLLRTDPVTGRVVYGFI